MPDIKELGNDVLILFGGGDGGGIKIDGNGAIHRIGPYGPAVASLGAAIGQLSRAAETLQSDTDGKDLAQVLDHTTQRFVSELGMPQDVHALVYIGDHFPWCIAPRTNRRPQPLPSAH